MTFWLQWTIVLVAMFVTDICWAYYIRRVKDAQALQSSLWAVFLFLTGAVGAISYVNNPWFLIPATLGAFVGTFSAVYLDGKKQRIGDAESKNHHAT